jgi:hypothetical protein
MPAPSFSDDELLALLRDETVAPESIVSEMEDAGATPHPAAALGAARTILKAMGPEQVAAIEALPPALRTIVLDVATDQQAIDLLSALAGSRDKAVVKDAKRCLHQMKARGVKVEPVRAPAPAPAPAPPVAEELPVFMSSIDGAGRRIIFFTGAARGGVDVAQLVISDETGVQMAELAQLYRKEYRRFLDRILGLTESFVAEIPRAYARSLIAQALDLNARARRPVPASFNDVTFLLGPAVGTQPSPGRSLPRPAEEAALRARGNEILDIREFGTWGPPEPIYDAFIRRIDEIDTSTLYIDETQKAASRREVIGNSVTTFWTREARELYATRLFDMAYLLQRAQRPEQSALVLATAWAVAGDEPLQTIPFVWRFYERFVPGPQGGHEPHAPPPATTPGGIILPP